MLLGGPQNTIKSHLVFTALFCFAPFSVFSSRLSAPYYISDMCNIYTKCDTHDMCHTVTQCDNPTRKI
jgi:hypothetical protein